ncbi:MAG TPA: dual specificity protein phosphatase family protein [Dongiaceae bacterium]|nr:dual specificity protein phosphatase family protein [Dongiaceae bacterium]
MDCTAITPALLVGPHPSTVEDFDYLKSESVTAILSLLSAEDSARLALRADIEAAKAAMVYRNVPVNDFDDLDLKQKLPVCVDTLLELLREGHKVYVHCTAGVTRSPTVIAAYLHTQLHWPLEEAIQRIQVLRSCCPRGDLIRLYLR